MEFKSLTEIYEHLESEALTYHHPHQTASLFGAIRDDAHQRKDQELVRLSQLEMDVFNFVFKDGLIFPTFVGTRDGVREEVPDFASLKDDGVALEYIESRLKKTTNRVLQAKYSSILWHSSRKHSRFAGIAVSAYLELVKVYEGEDIALPKEHYGSDLLNSLINAFYYAKTGKLDLTVVQSEIKRILDHYPVRSSALFRIRYDLLNLILKNRKPLGNDLFSSGIEYCRQFAKQKGLDPHAVIDFLFLGQRFEVALNTKTYNWNIFIAEQYEQLMLSALQAKNIVAQTFWQQAIDHYKLGGDDVKIKELEEKYSEVQGCINLGVIETEIDMTDVFKEYDEITNEVAEKDVDFIIKFLTISPALLPRLQTLRKRVKEMSKTSLLFSMAPMESMDQYGHTTDHFYDDDEKQRFHILNYFGMEIRNFQIHLIDRIITKTYSIGKLSRDAIISYLRSSAWFGKVYTLEPIPGRQMTFDWMNLISPAIHQYFDMLELRESDSSKMSAVLAIDSLTLKLEGLLRELLRLNGVNVFVNKRDNKQRIVTRMKTLDDLLREPVTGELLSEDDILFLKFLLVERVGLNLRHQVAHCLQNFESYSPHLAHLLMLAVLRLANFSIIPKEE